MEPTVKDKDCGAHFHEKIQSLVRDHLELWAGEIAPDKLAVIMSATLYANSSLALEAIGKNRMEAAEFMMSGVVRADKIIKEMGK